MPSTPPVTSYAAMCALFDLEALLMLLHCTNQLVVQLISTLVLFSLSLYSASIQVSLSLSLSFFLALPLANCCYSCCCCHCNCHSRCESHCHCLLHCHSHPHSALACPRSHLTEAVIRVHQVGRSASISLTSSVPFMGWNGPLAKLTLQSAVLSIGLSQVRFQLTHCLIVLFFVSPSLPCLTVSLTLVAADWCVLLQSSSATFPSSSC